MWICPSGLGWVLLPKRWPPAPGWWQPQLNIKGMSLGARISFHRPIPAGGPCADLVVRAVRCWLVPPCRVRGMPTVPGPERAWEHPITNKLFP